MALSPGEDPIRHLTAMMAQLVRHNQTLVATLDRLANGLADLAKDVRLGFRNVYDRMEALRTETNFRAVGARFDELEDRFGRLEDGIRDIRSDLLRLENGILNAQQSALEAHLRLDDRSEGDQDPAA